MESIPEGTFDDAEFVTQEWVDAEFDGGAVIRGRLDEARELEGHPDERIRAMAAAVLVAADVEQALDDLENARAVA